MILPIALLLVAVAIAMSAARLIGRSFASGRHPGGELVAWQVSSWSTALCVLSALTMLSVPWVGTATALPELLEQCLQRAGSSDSMWLPLAGRLAVGVALGAVVAQLGRTVIVLGQRHHVQRLRQRQTLDVIASRDEGRDRWTLRSDVAMVYCVPGRYARVVFTSEAIRRLDEVEQEAVCAHERAHLRWGHHRLIASTHLLASAFPRVELFRAAERRTRSLVEVHADQVAARTVSPVALMSALLHLVEGPTQPWPALNATGSGTTERVAFLVRQADLTDTDHIARRGGQRSWVLNAALLAAVAGAPLILSAVIHSAFCWV